ARITECTPEELEKLAEILELRGAQPRQVRMRQACFEAAELAPGMRVLDVGCGTGVVTRQLARVVGRKGRVVGVDPSAPLLDYARRCWFLARRSRTWSAAASASASPAGASTPAFT